MGPLHSKASPIWVGDGMPRTTQRDITRIFRDLVRLTVMKRGVKIAADFEPTGISYLHAYSPLRLKNRLGQ